MKVKGRNKNILLLIACVFSYISVALSLFAIIALMTNLIGVKDLYGEIMVAYGMAPGELDAQLNLMYIENAIVIFMNLSFANFYRKGYKYQAHNPQYARACIFNGVIQLLLGGAIISAILGIIAGVRMKKPNRIVQTVPVNNSEISDYKLTAMSEAVARLNELRDRGAISEEEYYANLNKILEG